MAVPVTLEQNQACPQGSWEEAKDSSPEPGSTNACTPGPRAWGTLHGREGSVQTAQEAGLWGRGVARELRAENLLCYRLTPSTSAVVSPGPGRRRPRSLSCSSWPRSVASTPGSSSRCWRPTPSWRVSRCPTGLRQSPCRRIPRFGQGSGEG